MLITERDHTSRTGKQLEDFIDMFFQHSGNKDIYCITGVAYINVDSQWEWGFTYVKVDPEMRLQSCDVVFARTYSIFFGLLEGVMRFTQVTDEINGIIYPAKRLGTHSIQSVLNICADLAASIVQTTIPQDLPNAIRELLKTTNISSSRVTDRILDDIITTCANTASYIVQSTSPQNAPAALSKYMKVAVVLLSNKVPEGFIMPADLSGFDKPSQEDYVYPETLRSFLSNRDGTGSEYI